MADDDREDMGFAEEELQVKAYDSRLMKRLLGFAARYRHLFLLAVILLFASTAADLARPYLIAVAIDDFIKKGDAVSLNRAGCISCCWWLPAFCSICSRYMSLVMRASLSYSISGKSSFHTCKSCPSHILTKILSEGS